MLKTRTIALTLLSVFAVTGCATTPVSSNSRPASKPVTTPAPVAEPEPVYTYKDAPSDAVFEQAPAAKQPAKESDQAPKEEWRIVSP